MPRRSGCRAGTCRRSSRPSWYGCRASSTGASVGTRPTVTSSMSTSRLPEPADAAAPLLVLFHGLEGNSRSHYSRVLMQAAADRGWRAMVVHFRGCSGEANLLARAYHSGDSEEGDWILRRVHARWPDAAAARGRHFARWQHVGKVARRTRGGRAVRRGGGIDRFAARPGRRRRGAGARLQPALHAACFSRR